MSFLYIYIRVYCPAGGKSFRGGCGGGWIVYRICLIHKLRLDFYPFSMSPRHSLVFRISSLFAEDVPALYHLTN